MERTAFTIYLVVLGLSPLLFGSVHTYAYTLVILLILTASLLLVFYNIVKDPQSDVLLYRWPVTGLNLLFFLVLAYLVLQIIPLPRGLVEILSPESWLIAEKSLPASQVAIAQHSVPNTLSLTPYRYPVRMSIIRWVAYGLFFLGFTQTLKSRKRIELAIGCILATACFSGLYGIFQTYSGYSHIWWFTKNAYLEDVTGTYINRNHFACFMGLALILAAAYSCSLSAGGRKEPRNSRVRLTRFLSHEQSFSKKMLVIASGIVIGIGLILSASRGGILAATAGLFFMGLLFASKRSQRRNGVIVFVIFGLITLSTFYIGAEHSWERFRNINASYAVRARYAETTLNLFNDFKLFGVGVGNFRYAYPKYQQAPDNYVFIEYAHNDWAQFLAEAGIIGFVFFLSGISRYIYQTIRRWKRREEPFYVAMGLAPLAALLLIGVHSYSDFNLHIPANFLVLTSLVAIGHGAFRLDNGTGEGPFPRFRSVPLKFNGVFFLFFSLLLVLGTTWGTIRHFIAETYCNTVQNSTFNRDPFPAAEKVKKAISWQPGNAAYRYKLAQALMKERRPETDQKTAAADVAIVMALEKAALFNPLEAVYHFKLGWEYLGQSPPASDNTGQWRIAADISMERAAFFVGERNPWQYKELGDYWVMRSKTFSAGSPPRKNALVTAQRYYKKALHTQSDYDKPRLYQDIERTVKRNYPVAEEQFPFELGF